MSDKLNFSFCTSCMGRLHDLEKTYINNIELALKVMPDCCTFTLLNWNSGDGMHEWVDRHLRHYIDTGIVKYIVTHVPDTFSQSITKNITMKHSTGDVVCNLDADNFLQVNFLVELISIFRKFKNPIVGGPVNKTPLMCGIAGRVACRKKSFLELRGFDESFTGWGYEELDFIRRFELYYDTQRIVLTEKWLSSSDGYRYMSEDERKSNSINCQKSTKKISNGHLINDVEEWGKIPT